jgi:hypothetical protein
MSTSAAFLGSTDALCDRRFPALDLAGCRDLRESERVVPRFEARSPEPRFVSFLAMNSLPPCCGRDRAVNIPHCAAGTSRAGKGFPRLKEESRCRRRQTQ